MKKNKIEDTDECVFCKIIAGKIPRISPYEDDKFLVLIPLEPIADGHCLIIPKAHYTTLLDMPATLGTELIGIAKQQSLRLIKEKKAEGFNIIQNNFKAGGQEVNHVHFHVIPRKLGDNIRFLSKKE